MNSTAYSEITLLEQSALAKLLPKLKGRVFHITKAEYYESIVAMGLILPNTNNDLKTSFGSSKNSFFKNRNCVSVFDYRSIPEDKFQKFCGRCPPTLPLSPESPSIMVLYLSDNAMNHLISWNELGPEKYSSEMILPYIEAGHPGPIPINDIAEVLKVTIQIDPDSIVSRLRRAHQKMRANK